MGYHRPGMAITTAVGIIPARRAATRFPGKPLARIAGRPMLEWVFAGAGHAKRLSRVLVATDHSEIVSACHRFGAEAVLTSPEHPTGTDRVAEVAAGLSENIIVNIQGDEPLIEGFVIDAAVAALEADPAAPMATIVHPAESSVLDDPNRVKVVLDQRNRALYFSRAPIPAALEPGREAPYWQHVGLYAYRRSFLLEFVKLPRTPLERAEGLEQLRALEHGFPIAVAVIEGWQSIPVDVPEDIPCVETALRAREQV